MAGSSIGLCDLSLGPVHIVSRFFMDRRRKGCLCVGERQASVAICMMTCTEE